MASRPLRRSCCGRSKRKAQPKDFCALLKISAGVTLIESNGMWSININHSGQQKDLKTAIQTHNCPDRTAGVQLAKVCLHALSSAVKNGKQETLRGRVGRQMPLVLLKEFLFNTAGPCTGCRGRGCTACNKMGVV